MDLLGTGKTPLHITPGMMIGAERTLTSPFVSTGLTQPELVKKRNGIYLRCGTPWFEGGYRITYWHCPSGRACPAGKGTV